LGSWTLWSFTFVGYTSAGLTQDLFRAGGPVSAPGYRAHQFAATSLVTQRIEAQMPIPFVTFPIGRWGRSPARATLAPYLSLVGFESSDGNYLGYPSAGLGLLTFFDLVRFDVARGIRNGRWSFGVDIGRDLWRIL
jgi:hypothetical protein